MSSLRMGTKVDSKSYLPGYYSMRELNEDSSSSSWPLCYGEKAITNGQYYNGFMSRTVMDGYPGYGKDALKQKMLEHEAVFKNQVCELHRLYRIQRAMMEEFRIRPSMEPSSSSSLRGPQLPPEEARKWHTTGFPLFNSNYDRTSISWVEIGNSPMSCTKGNNDAQTSQILFQNGSSVKDSELLDSRPLKVRKKLFDLELPADEYIDTEDGKSSPDCKSSHVSSYAPNGNLKSGHETQKLSPAIDCRIDVSASASCLRNSTRLADLNEPIDVEEATAPSSADFLGHNSITGHRNGVMQLAKSNAVVLGGNAKTSHFRDAFLTNSSVEVNERRHISNIYEAGPSRSNLDSVTPGLQQDKSHPMQCMPNLLDHPSGAYLARQSREDFWREGNHHHRESSYRSRDQSNRFLGPHIASRAPNSDQFFHPSYFSGTWAHTASSWAKPTKSFTQKLTALDPCLNPAMDRELQIQAECRENFGGKWLNRGLADELSTQNGFYHGSGSSSKDLRGQFDYFNSCRGENVASDAINHGFGHFGKGSSFAESKPAIDINLNEEVSKSSSNEVMILHDSAAVDEIGKPEVHVSSLPWLKNKPALAKNETIRDLNEPFTPKVSTLDSSERKTEMVRSQNVKKIMGFPIFDEPLSHVSTSTSFSCPRNGSGVDKEKKKRVIDINLECEPDEEEAVEKEKPTKCGSVRDFIDLNSCITDCEEVLAPSYESKTAIKVILDIDLESPVLPEKEDDVIKPAGNITDSSSEDEVLRTAAEAMVAISASSPNKIHLQEKNIDLLEASVAESFLLFVNTVSSFPDEDLSEEMDEFEAMTLQIQETKEEDYMPTLFVPELLKIEEPGANTVTRPRRGQSRRGRQRRDFQRDILPGLTSLARHEVTEDIQTFGGMMKATGHHWISGLARRNGARNGAGRGRRRAVVDDAATATPLITTAAPSQVCNNPPLIQQLSIEAGLEAWGKTPRRPRRQRCPAGNPPTAVVLT